VLRAVPRNKGILAQVHYDVSSVGDFSLPPRRNEICALLGFYAAYGGPYRRFGTTYRSHF